MAEKLHALMEAPDTRRERIQEKTIEGIKDIFPIVGRTHTLHVKNLKAKTKDYSSQQQKEAILKGQTLHVPITGQVELRDNVTGKAVSTADNHTLMHLPYFTPRHTFIVGGNEYDVPHQLRLKPGVYTRERANGEFEAAFNLSKGSNFRLSMEPESGRLHMEMGTSKIPLYSVLKALDVPEKDIKQYWGTELLDVNASKFSKKEEASINKLVSKIKRYGDNVPTTYEGKKRYIADYFDRTEMDPKVNERTLRAPVSRANALALLKASKKLIDVQKNEDVEDDRDSLEFKTIHSVDDFFKERLNVDAKRTIGRKLLMKLNQSRDNDVKKIVPNSTFTKSINGFLTSSDLKTISMQINPIEMIDQATRVTSVGEGGISSTRAIPFESRKVHNTHLGVLDPVRTPETEKAGVDVRSSIYALRDDKGNLYTEMINARTGKKENVSTTTLAQSTVGFSGQPRKGSVDAVRGSDVVSVDAKEVDFFLPTAAQMFSPATALVPLLNGMQGNRAIMGSKFQTQALPLLEREAPYVQAAGPIGNSVERDLARFVAPTSKVDGTITKIDDGFIYIRPDGPKTAAPATVKVPYETYFPLAAKTYLHNDLKIKKGDRVKKNQILAESNFTKDDTLALGKNMSVGYMAYYGKNSNDAVVISEGAAKKLTSSHMYKHALSKGQDVILGKKKYVTYYPGNFTAAQLAKLDDYGVAKPGETFDKGDPLILGMRKAAPTPEAALLGNFHKSLVKPYRDITVTWEKTVPCTVQDAMNAARQIMVTVRTEEAMKIGDKLANRFGGKGVISEIIPDEKMVHDEAGKPIDVLFTSAGVVSRINPAQIVESALGKVVEKTGKPIVLEQFQEGDNVQFAKELLKKHNIKDKETVYDPVSDKKVPGVFVGRSYIHKLFKSTDTNYSARGVDDYDVNLQPTRGGDDGAKGVGKMEINALLAHNARNVLKEALTVKSEKSDEFWRAYEFGLPAPPPKTPFAAEKFVAMLQGAGVNVDKSGTNVSLAPLTDDDVKKLSSGALDEPSLDKSKSYMVRAKDMSPEKGGLFDPALTGGMTGTRWAHMRLKEPVVNPVFEEPVRRLLGYTKKELRSQIGEVGGAGIKAKLNRIDLKKKEQELIELTKTKKGAELDNAVKQLKYIKALRSKGFSKAGNAYTLSNIPVIPPVMRPILPSARGNELQVADANYLYRDVGLANSALKDVQELGLPSVTADARHHLHDTTSALFGLTSPTSPQLQSRQAKGLIEQLTGANSPKSGFFHKKLLARRQDLSGRATATPDNTLNMDQIGIPEDMLWATYSKFIMKGLIQQGYKPMIAREMFDNRHPTAKSILDSELANRPVFVNRAPSLHRHNFVAAYPVPVEGKSLRVNPFMERGQNLDYDGDAMQIHVPIGTKAVDEAKNLTLSKLLFSDKSKDDLMIFPQHEAILGTYLGTVAPKGRKVHKFKNKAEAMKAYRRGEITVNSPVQIGRK